MVVGSPYESYYSNERIGDPGGVYVFTFDDFSKTWMGRTKLTPPGIEDLSDYCFGSSVALHDGHNLLFVGAPNNTHTSNPIKPTGNVHVFHRQTEDSATAWIPIKTITMSKNPSLLTGVNGKKS